jgi:uncharacterized SAM-binding protein YcdF (DUF218 family)
MSTILIIVLLILLLGGGGYYSHSRYGGTRLGGILGLFLLIAGVVWLVGGFADGLIAPSCAARSPFGFDFQQGQAAARR